MASTAEVREEQQSLVCFEIMSQTATQICGSTVPTASADTESNRSHLISAARPEVEDAAKRLTEIVTEFNSLLTDSSEKLLRLRHVLSGLLEVLSTYTKGMKRFPGCVPSMLVAGANTTGKSTVTDFLLCSAACSPETDPAVNKLASLPGASVCGVSSSPYASLSVREGSLRRSSGTCSVTNASDTNPSQSNKARVLPTRWPQVSVDSGTERSCLTSPRGVQSSGRCAVGSVVDSSHGCFRDSEMNPCQAHTSNYFPSLCSQERNVRRLERSDDDGRCGTFPRVVNFPHFSSFRGRCQRGSDTSLSNKLYSLERATTIKPGAYDMTIHDRFCAVGERVKEISVRDKYIMQRRCTVPLRPGQSWYFSDNLSSSSTSSSISSATCASPWLLKELKGGVVWTERGAMSSFQFPNLLRGDAILYTIPCEVIGTRCMVECVTDLFSPFTYHVNDGDPSDNLCNSFSSSGRSIGRGELPLKSDNLRQTVDNKAKGNELQQIRQLITDMTFFVITFCDAVLLRESGASIGDAQLLDRPPPMVSSIPELIDLFTKNMKELFGVSVSIWQVIPYSGPFSHATHNVLSALDRKNMQCQDHGVTGGKLTEFVGGLVQDGGIPPPSPSVLTVSSTERKNGSSCNYSGSPKELTVEAAVEMYCRVVFGQNFARREEKLPPLQLEQLVVYDAVNSMWRKSGANQLLCTVRMFEKGSELSVFLRIAVSIVMWCYQLRGLLVKARKAAARRSRTIRMKLTKTQALENVVKETLKSFKLKFIPRVTVRELETMVQRKFESITISFWGKILDLLDEAYENTKDDCLVKQRHVVRRCPLQSNLSEQVRSVRRRLRAEFCDLYHHFVSLNFRKQIQQLRLIMAEQAAQLRSVVASRPVETIGAALENNEAAVTRFPAASKRETIGYFATGYVGGTAEEASHHIPYVESNAKELKMIMERELTLRLSRFNTEVINYLMWELSGSMQEIVEECNAQRRMTESQLELLFSPLKASDQSDRLNWEALNSRLEHLTNYNFLSMQPTEHLEPFVTDLRTSIVEDQIMLMLGSEGCFGTSEVRCGERTLSYLNKYESKVCSRQVKEQRFSMNITYGRPPLSPLPNDELLYTPVKPEELISSPALWEQNFTTTLRSETAPFSATANDAMAGQDKGVLTSEWSSVLPSSNPLWFIIAVWQVALPSMTFRPWIQLPNVNYATLLSSVDSIFTSKCESLLTKLKGEILHLDGALRAEHEEKSRTESQTIKGLQHLSACAVHVANDFSRLRGTVFMTEELCEMKKNSVLFTPKYA